MVKRTWNVEHGQVWLWGDENAFDGERPLVLLLSGALSAENSQALVQNDLRDVADVLVGHMPGNHCPTIGDDGVYAAAAAYDEVLDRLGRAALVCGSSMGGLAAMALRSRHVQQIIALDPFLSTAKVWPFEVYRRNLAAQPGDARLARFLWATFGISQSQHIDRDYRQIVAELQTPTLVLAGEVPLLPRRPLDGLPSLLDEPERRLFLNHPQVTLEVLPGVGHVVIRDARKSVVAKVRERLGV